MCGEAWAGGAAEGSAHRGAGSGLSCVGARVAVGAVLAWTGRGSRGRESEVWGNLGNASRNGARGAGVQGQELPAGREPSESEGALTLGVPGQAAVPRVCPQSPHPVEAWEPSCNWGRTGEEPGAALRAGQTGLQNNYRGLEWRCGACVHMICI